MSTSHQYSDDIECFIDLENSRKAAFSPGWKVSRRYTYIVYECEAGSASQFMIRLNHQAQDEFFSSFLL